MLICVNYVQRVLFALAIMWALILTLTIFRGVIVPWYCQKLLNFILFIYYFFIVVMNTCLFWGGGCDSGRGGWVDSGVDEEHVPAQPQPWRTLHVLCRPLLLPARPRDSTHWHCHQRQRVGQRCELIDWYLIWLNICIARISIVLTGTAVSGSVSVNDVSWLIDWLIDWTLVQRLYPFYKMLMVHEGTISY
jgi:hypothetical protein